MDTQHTVKMPVESLIPFLVLRQSLGLCYTRGIDSFLNMETRRNRLVEPFLFNWSASGIGWGYGNATSKDSLKERTQLAGSRRSA